VFTQDFSFASVCVANLKSVFMKNDLLKRTTIIGAIFTLTIAFSQQVSAQDGHRSDSTARLKKEKQQEKREEHKMDKKAEKFENKEEHKEKKIAKDEDKIEKAEKRDEKREGKKVEKQERRAKKDSTKAN
jgi:hypothetical protein